MDIETSKLVANAYNKSDDWHAFLINLDLVGIKLEDAEKAWLEANEILVDTIRAIFKKNDNRIDFKKMIDKAHQNCDKHMVLPYFTGYETVDGFKRIVVRMTSSSGNEISSSVSCKIIEDMMNMRGINVNKTLLCQALAECIYKYHS